MLGPTGTRKSDTALAVAEELGGEIVGCDALQIYRGLDAGTAKPSPAQRAAVPHHLVDVLDPRVDSTLATYVRAAERVLRGITARGRLPIVVGGTGLYLRGLLYGVAELPQRDDALRGRLRGMIARRGAARMHRWLARLAPRAAGRLSPRDTQRLVRALEIEIKSRTDGSPGRDESGAWTASPPRYRSLKIGLDMERARLFPRLDRRVDRFLERGLIEEVRGLLRAGVPPTANAFKAIGYREVLRALNEGRDPRTVGDEIRRNTRRYAKRQRTWFRGEPDVHWLDAEGPFDARVGRILELWRTRTA